MTDYRVIKTGAIPAVTEVRLYDETLDHVREDHPEVPIELPCMASAVERAITQPTHVESSHGGSFVFVDEESTNASGDPLRVPVKPIVGTSARVRTVLFAEADTPDDKIVYRRKRP
jgi:hypothetical protein